MKMPLMGVGLIFIVLNQCFSTFFSHCGLSASLTHVICILRHEYKPTKFIILFIA